MTEAEKTKESWRERKIKIKRRWLAPFIFVEWLCERLSYLLGQWAFLDILGHAGRLTIIVAVIFYFAESDSRRKAKHYQAWQVINSAQGKIGSGGRVDALHDLCSDGISLVGVNISMAHIPELSLENANLRCATIRRSTLDNSNLGGAILFHADLSLTSLLNANLSRADLEGANLARADLRYVDLKAIKGWQKIKCIELANIYGIKNPPDRFKEWAQEHGAVSIASGQEWYKLLNEKIEEKKQEADNSSEDREK